MQKWRDLHSTRQSAKAYRERGTVPGAPVVGTKKWKRHKWHEKLKGFEKHAKHRRMRREGRKACDSP